MGQTLSAADMVTQLIYRAPFISSRTNALFYINRAIRYWDGQGSFSFNCKFDATAFSFAAGTTTASVPSDMDTGQDVYIMSTIGNPYPITKKGMSKYGVSGINPPLKTQVNVPDHYIITGRTIEIYPAPQVNITLSAFYHIITQAVTDDNTSHTLFPDNFDDIIMDWAEAEIKRIFRIIGWTEIYGRCMDQGKMLIDQYRTDTDLAAGEQEAVRQVKDLQINQAK